MSEGNEISRPNPGPFDRKIPLPRWAFPDDMTDEEYEAAKWGDSEQQEQPNES